MKKLLSISILILCFSILGFAHNGEWSESITDLESWDGITLTHNEDLNNPDEEYKGFAQITITNNMTEDWGDFHIEIIGGKLNNDVYIDTDYSAPQSTIAGFTWQADGPQKIDYFFYDNPLTPGNTAVFTFYTNNETSQNEWYTISFRPTPVPEPATMALLGLGAIVLIRKRK